MRYIQKIALLVGMLGALSNGCKNDNYQREMYSLPQTMEVNSPFEMEEMIREYNPERKDDHVADYVGAWQDIDQDGIEDFYVDAGSFNVKNGFCLGRYVVKSSDLEKASKEEYASNLENLFQAKGREAQRKAFSEVYRSLSYPTTLHRDITCSPGSF